MIDGREYDVSTNAMPLPELAPGNREILIKAIGDGVSHLDSRFSAIFNHEVAEPDPPIVLSSPTNITVLGTQLSWGGVEGASGYILQVNDDEPVLVLAESCEFTDHVPGIYTIRIYAKGDGIIYLDSPISAYVHEISATTLSAVLDVQIVDNLVIWTAVDNAVSYLVDISGVEMTTQTNEFKLETKLPGDYLITVKAVGDQIYFLDSIWSETVIYSVPVPTYITAIGDQLYLGEDVFRFVSFNVPNLLVLEDPYWHMVDPWEQEDAIKSVQLMGGRVIRTYTLSIVGGIRPAEGGNQLAHILGKGIYSEALFVALDKAIQLANEHGVYLIIPFIDEWNWFGGITEFAALYGKTKSQFFTNAEVKQAFKDLIYYVLNRTNTFTGVKYKDDPAILAWELGNELRSATDAWIGEMAAYVKSIDANHLLMSGRDKITSYDLTNTNIDIVSAHYYTNNGTGTFADRAKADRALSLGKKPFIIGEYGLVDVQQLENMITESVNNGTSGSLIWSLRFRNVDGGFYYHGDFPTRSYHYPGFALNDDYHETRIVNFIIQAAHAVAGLGTYSPPIPEAPYLFAVEAGALTWRGATASFAFTVESRIVGDEEWVVLATLVCDAYEAGPFFVDDTVEAGRVYEYRVKAVNQAGESPYSNIVTYSHGETPLS